MADHGAAAAATRRLSQALDALDAAVERRREIDRASEAMGAQLHALGNDRAKLAADLDGASARAQRLDVANRNAVRRIDLAVETIRDIVERNDR